MSMRASAICAAARTARVRLARSSPKPPEDRALPSTRARSRRLPDDWNAGTTPNSSPTATDSPSVKARTTRSSHRDRHERGHGAKHGGGRRQAERAAAPGRPGRAGRSRSGADARSCPGPPPALRGPPARAGGYTPRASSSPATLTQAMSSTSRVAPANAMSAGRYSPTISSSSGITRVTRAVELRRASRPPASVLVRTPGDAVVHALQDGADLGRGPLGRDALPEPAHRAGGHNVGLEHVRRPHLHARAVRRAVRLPTSVHVDRIRCSTSPDRRASYLLESAERQRGEQTLSTRRTNNIN